MAKETFTVSDHTSFKNKMLNWANRFNIFCFLDNNHYLSRNNDFDCMLAAGCTRSVTLHPGNAFHSLRSFFDSKPSWLFGHFGYALKDEVEQLSSRHPDFIDFGAGFFFEPEILLQLRGDQLCIETREGSGGAVFREISGAAPHIQQVYPGGIQVQPRLEKAAYIKAVQALQQHIKRGDCYEINFCQQFFSENAEINPLFIFNKLAEVSPNPFSAFYKLNDKFCLCASPERYLKKTGTKLISQPIKGTTRRNMEDKELDDVNRNYLLKSEKERSENVMIVDLVRNDLSRICRQGSVSVEELFAVYSFPQVHQMISTITGELETDIHWTDAIKATFPMGSMTGAPKKSVMKLIDQYEVCARGLFSGAIGYVTPDADFDFNVVIRSIFYDENKKRLSFSAGGGITFSSDAEDEYNESLLKAAAIKHLLEEH